MSDRTTINLEIPEDIKSKLAELAKEKEMSLSGLVRFILKDYLKNNDKR